MVFFPLLVFEYSIIDSCQSYFGEGYEGYEVYEKFSGIFLFWGGVRNHFLKIGGGYEKNSENLGGVRKLLAFFPKGVQRPTYS